MINIYDTANQLASDFQKTEQFTKLKEAIAAVKADETSLALYHEMESFQKEILEKQQKGEGLGDAENARYKELNEKVQANAKVMQVIQAEQGIYALLDDIQKTVAKPISDLYTEISGK